MTPTELVEALSAFVTLAKEADAAYKAAVAKEQQNNDATQDILHIAELAPEVFQETDLLPVLHQLRVDRREAKKELEVTDLFAQWAEKNKKAIDVLSNQIGQMKRVLARQPRDMYCLKTDVAGRKGDWITHREDAPLPGQIELEYEKKGDEPSAF